MKKFQFTLDGVLGYRQQVLESRQNEYAKFLVEVRQQQDRVDDATERYHSLNQRFHEQAADGITAADALGFENGLRVLEAEIAREMRTLEELEIKAEEMRAQVLQAHMDTAVLERLKDKKLDAYQKEVQKSDEQFIDELVSTERVMKSE